MPCCARKTSESHAIDAAYKLETIGDRYPNVSKFEILTSLNDAPLDLVVTEITNKIPWIAVPAYALDWTIVPIIFNIGTGLAVLYGVRQRKLWPILPAIVCHAAQRELDLYIHLALSYRNVVEFISSYKLLSDFAGWIGNDASILLFFGMNPISYILPALPSLALALYFRKALIHSQSDKTP